MASAQGIFLGLTLSEVQAIRASAVAQLTAGKTRMSISADGISVTYAFVNGMSIREILLECAYALNFLDGNHPVTRTYSSFRRGYSGNLAID
jgi:hypothetical protein